MFTPCVCLRRALLCPGTRKTIVEKTRRKAGNPRLILNPRFLLCNLHRLELTVSSISYVIQTTYAHAKLVRLSSLPLPASP